MVFCNLNEETPNSEYGIVTILILIDGFLQYKNTIEAGLKAGCHNPYFNRWFSAILERN